MCCTPFPISRVPLAVVLSAIIHRWIHQWGCIRLNPPRSHLYVLRPFSGSALVTRLSSTRWHLEGQGPDLRIGRIQSRWVPGPCGVFLSPSPAPCFPVLLWRFLIFFPMIGAVSGSLILVILQPLASLLKLATILPFLFYCYCIYRISPPSTEPALNNWNNTLVGTNGQCESNQLPSEYTSLALFRSRRKPRA